MLALYQTRGFDVETNACVRRPRSRPGRDRLCTSPCGHVDRDGRRRTHARTLTVVCLSWAYVLLSATGRVPCVCAVGLGHGASMNQEADGPGRVLKKKMAREDAHDRQRVCHVQSLLSDAADVTITGLMRTVSTFVPDCQSTMRCEYALQGVTCMYVHTDNTLQGSFGRHAEARGANIVYVHHRHTSCLRCRHRPTAVRACLSVRASPPQCHHGCVLKWNTESTSTCDVRARRRTSRP